MKKIFTYKRPSGVTLTEYYENGEFYFIHSDGQGEKRLSLYTLESPAPFIRNPWLGHTEEEVLASGEDILAKKLLQNGDPDYIEVKKAMPELVNNVYSFLSGTASWSGVTVLTNGDVIHQASGRNRKPSPIFKPTESCEVLGALTPRQMLLAGELPVLISLFTDGRSSLELIYFVEAGDTDRDPVVWIREKKYENNCNRCNWR